MSAPRWTIGGAERVLVELATAQRGDGFQIAIIAPPGRLDRDWAQRWVSSDFAIPRPSAIPSICFGPPAASARHSAVGYPTSCTPTMSRPRLLR